MKTIIGLDRQEEIDALYGEGFTLHFGSESVVVRVLSPRAVDTRTILEKMTGVPRAKRESRGDVPCAYCDDKFVSASGLSSHQRSQHPENFERKGKLRSQEFKCQHAGCDYQTDKAGWMRNHVARTHKTGAL